LNCVGKMLRGKMLRTLPTQSYDDFIICVQDRGRMLQLRQELSLTVPQQVTLVKAFVFNYYAREVVTNPVTEADVAMIREARRVLELAEQGPSESLQALLTRYTTLLSEWLRNDRPRISYPFAVKFHQLRQIADAAKERRHYYYQEVAALANHAQQQLLSILYSLRGVELPTGDAEQVLTHLRTTFVDIADQLEASAAGILPDPELQAQYYQDAATLFWELFREQLPSYLPVVHLLSDFAHRYARLDQHVRRVTYLLQEQLDIEFIKQQIETRTVTFEHLRGYLRIVLDATKAISAQADEAPLEERFAALIAAEGEPYAVLRAFFQALFTYYDDLEQRVAAARPDPVAYGVAAVTAELAKSKTC
jgi:hypothetical protein